MPHAIKLKALSRQYARRFKFNLKQHPKGGMGTTNKIPDAWDDDDWVAKAQEPSSEKPILPPKKLTKAERRAQQAEFNRRLWADAEEPAPAFYVETKYEAPLQSSLKSNVTLLARKPASTLATRKGLTAGVDGLSLEDDEDDDAEEKPQQLTPEERALKAQKEREEKQRRYEEVREKLFGPPNSEPTPSRTSYSPARNEKSRGRGRGYLARDGRDNRPESSASGRSKHLYDPNSPAKLDSASTQKAAFGSDMISESPIICNPRGPDGSGRGGVGFVGRGNKAP
ncbi:MAG: hypothetical protein GOMPHAMPRED_007092 [Gomphillus americanus]|uniref:SUZ domain-containing protein n=1 Tax=Gomphillus americanus TaxID=1940652 RepID=A0A8H3EPN6_9LECA|nr:MAG: hypothetical protein GOMPHAMPRED_007092 [Gomphillus americanus]